MLTVTTLWIPFTVTAALAQVARNAMQRQLTGPLGTWGATNIRFLFGFPFSVVFFVIVLAVTGDHVTWPTAVFWDSSELMMFHETPMLLSAPPFAPELPKPALPPNVLLTIHTGRAGPAPCATR